MAKLPYFKWYVSDAESDENVRAMDDADLGFYLRCLNHAWLNGSLPADPAARARCLRTRLDTANRRWIRVGKCFVTSTSLPDRLINLRQESERELATSKSLKCAESAKAKSERSADAPPRALARADSDSVSVSSSVVVLPLNAKSGDWISGRFDEWLSPWTRCANPDEACRAWISVVNSIRDEEGAFAARDGYLASDEVARKVIMEPAKWLYLQKKAHWLGTWPEASKRSNTEELTASIEALRRTR